MEHQSNPDNKKFDQNFNEVQENTKIFDIHTRARLRMFNIRPLIEDLHSVMENIGEEALQSLELSEVTRKPRKANGERENNAEHTLMLGITAQKFTQKYRPDLDPLKVRTMCDLHDKIEIFTGDVATYSITKEEREAKKQAEEKAMPLLMERLDSDDQAILGEYEEQESKESRFVRLFDKLMPYIVDFHGQGSRVLVEDYGVESVESYAENDAEYARALMEEYDEPELNVLHMIRQYFSDQVKHQLAFHFEMEEIEKQKEELRQLVSSQEDGGYIPEWQNRDDVEMLEDIKLKEEALEG